MQEITIHITNLKKIVEQKQYDFEAVKFREIIGKILKDGENKLIEDYLDAFVKDAPSDFYKSQLAIMILGIYEKHLDKNKALNIAKKILEYTEKPSYALSSVLRICRIINNYEYAKELLKKKPGLQTTETFEVLYELIYFYESNEDFDAIEKSIELIIKKYPSSKPVLNTTKALAVKYDLFDKYKNYFIKSDISDFFDSEKTIKNRIFYDEYEKILDNYERALSSAALTDLTKGIAHEFGQPVTNIRFGIQYFSKIITEQQSDKIEKEMVLNIFSDILLQTKRIGKLIDTLSPITSTKSKITKFNIKNAIRSIFEQEKIKLNSLKIEYSINNYKNKEINIEFDNVQFNQIITNLLNNSIDSISEIKKENFRGNIRVLIEELNEKITIYFSDNGKGIPKKQQKRIFNPFYTTKEVGKGQGLGLYIISKLLEINGGKIYIDKKYKKGAKFIIHVIKKHKNEI